MTKATVDSFAMLLVLVGSSSLSAEEGWGSLTGQFVIKGEAPPAPTFDLGTDKFCCQAKPKDESLVIGEQGGIANVVVYLQPARRKPVVVHPELAAKANEPIKVTNEGCKFSPRVLLVQPGQPVTLANADPTSHNVRAELGAESFNVLLKEEASQEVTLKKSQRLPMPIGCNIHPFMRAWIVVRDDPYMAASDSAGKFVIVNLPAGKHEFQFWHERAGYLSNAAYTAGKSDRRGRIEVTIPAGGAADLGTIFIGAAELTGN